MRNKKLASFSFSFHLSQNWAERGGTNFCISVLFYLLINWLFFASSIVFHSCFFLNPRLPKKKKWKNWFFFCFFSDPETLYFWKFFIKEVLLLYFSSSSSFLFRGKKNLLFRTLCCKGLRFLLETLILF